jgi:hypothetical protein
MRESDRVAGLIKKSFEDGLVPQDLVSPSLACQAWRPAVIGLILSHIDLLSNDKGRIVRIESRSDCQTSFIHTLVSS